LFSLSYLGKSSNIHVLVCFDSEKNVFLHRTALVDIQQRSLTYSSVRSSNISSSRSHISIVFTSLQLSVYGTHSDSTRSEVCSRTSCVQGKKKKSRSFVLCVLCLYMCIWCSCSLQYFLGGHIICLCVPVCVSLCLCVCLCVCLYNIMYRHKAICMNMCMCER
jgi:hypothetical protein